MLYVPPCRQQLLAAADALHDASDELSVADSTYANDSVFFTPLLPSVLAYREQTEQNLKS